MVSALLTALTGFAAGLWYARGKPEPLKSALVDTQRLCRCGMAVAHKAYNWIKEAAAEEQVANHTTRTP